MGKGTQREKRIVFKSKKNHITQKKSEWAQPRMGIRDQIQGLLNKNINAHTQKKEKLQEEKPKTNTEVTKKEKLARRQKAATEKE